MNQRTTIVAALGPTNTGKTYRATRRMLEHESGMMGLPLRLLAREVYDKLVAECGREQVALVTGEEKRVPPGARYWVCTVEAMPLDVEVDFVAVDEIQLTGHRERGHVFTDRLLHARGRRETWFLGSDTMVGLVRQLVPTAQLERYPRLSQLRAEGSYTLGSLPPRSAVVAFSMSRVYELAERIKIKRGGAAIVLGALSPRARNAQVEMYQSGEVDYLVATDAIGMGLNLDVDRVAFADLSKFDGQRSRELRTSELAQIAGRAGRHLKDGAFGTLAPQLRLAPEIERAIETHRFEPQRQAQWRNSNLDMSSVSALIDSLHQPPHHACLQSVHTAEDAETLHKLASRSAVMQRARSHQSVELLWEACQIPDYRKLLVDEHANLVEQIYLRLVEHGRLPDDFLEERLDRLLRHQGDIDSIMNRIAFCRTWTYVTGRDGWVDHRRWQARARDIEERLSDQLHEALVERFVSKRKRVVAPLASAGSRPDPRRKLAELKAAWERKEEVPPLLERLRAAADEQIEIGEGGAVTFDGYSLGQLVAGRTLLEPDVRWTLDELGMEAREVNLRVQARIRNWVDQTLSPLEALASADASSVVRGLHYQLRTGLGSAFGPDMQTQKRALDEADRERLARAGVVVGRHAVYSKAALKGWVLRRRHLLASCFFQVPAGQFSGRILRSLPPSPADSEQVRVWANALGFGLVGDRLLRWDVLERVVQAIAAAGNASPSRSRPGGADGEEQHEQLVTRICSWCGCKRAEAERLCRDLGGPSRRRKPRASRRERSRRSGRNASEGGRSTVPRSGPSSRLDAGKRR